MSGEQGHLFEDAPWEADDAAEALVATLVFPGPLEGEFDYLVPEPYLESIRPGRRVEAPLGRGNRPVIGYCVKIETKEVGERKLKYLSRVMDEKDLLSPAMIRLTRWIAERYLCSWGQVLETVVPAGVRTQAGTRLAKYVYVNDEVRALVRKAKKFKLPLKQAKALKVLVESDSAITTQELARTIGSTQAPINSLIKKGLVETEKRRTPPQSVQVAASPQVENLPLNTAQQTALDAIVKALHAGEAATLLLHGITGSGKTEVYIRAIQEVLTFGRQAIVLVPEISLTPQTVERFRARFPQVAVLHSHLSDAERHWHWEQIASGEVSVVVGARSAVFAPTPHLGLILMDEEHETSFKQENAPRYHTREVALQRARMEKIPLVLGSATPSLESWHRTQTKEYQLLTLPHRIHHRPLPTVRILDLRRDSASKSASGAISPLLAQEMERELEKGGQVILLLNRRGYSTHIQCPSCGEVLTCNHCDIAMTYHRQDDVALCHYCDHEEKVPRTCAACGFGGIRFSGLGTQKLEKEVQQRFANYRCLRMDTDTMHAPGSHQRALAAFREGKIRILLGTQMIAKGLDFPDVTLVGVINADLALHMPDFRSAERTFQLLAQVAGRAGRGDRGGRVFVQTYSPEHPAIQAASRHDYFAFADQELPLREALNYPPFGTMVRIILRGPREQQVARMGEYLKQQYEQAAETVGATIRLLGPAPAPITKLRDKFRYNLQLQSKEEQELRDTLLMAQEQMDREKSLPDDVEWIIDIDPMSML
ncbi:Primosomal protein N' [Planctomycetales bacterium 10988]|nr:Primosomal protein N' [Planctomycetales bacterium 10988]